MAVMVNIWPRMALCSIWLHRAVFGHMFTVTAMGSSMSKVQLLSIGRIIVNNNQATGKVMTTFTRTSKLTKWYNFRWFADVIYVDVSIVNNRTSRIAQLVFQVRKRNI